MGKDKNRSGAFSRRKSKKDGGDKKKSSKTAKNTKKDKKKKGAGEKKKGNSQVRDFIVAIIVIAIGIFLLIAFQTSAAGAIGNLLGDVFKGVFGFAAYILPYYCIAYGILLFMRKTIHVSVRAIVLFIIIFLMIALLNSAGYMNKDVMSEPFWNPSVHYENGMILSGGGAFGMLLGKLIARLIGIPGLYIFSIVIIIICLLLILNTPVSRFFEKARERREKRSEEKQQRQEERERAKEEVAVAEYKSMESDDDLFEDGSAHTDVNDKQKKILGYVKDDDLKSGNENEEEKEELDFSLGENKEKKDRAGKSVSRLGRKKNDDRKKEKNFDGPVIVGGISPKTSDKDAAKETLSEDDFNTNVASSESYQFPSIDLLKKPKKDRRDPKAEENALRSKAAKLEETLHSFNIDAQVTNVTQGPAVTRYEVHPNSGVKVKGIKSLSDDIALNMEAKSIRIEAPIPGKPAVGIEIENDKINMVTVREIIESEAFRDSRSKISFAVGKDIAGNAIVADLKAMPHMLIAGSTGSGKSVCINSIITSILYKARPDEVKLILIDPKVVELSNYNGIPHLLIPVVTEPAKAAAALNWAVAEMDERYRKFADEGVRDLAGYNDVVEDSDDEEMEPMPQVVIIIDELADLMMAAPAQVEESICRLAQKARAAGMHLIVATQRPSVDVITGVIKANIPSRIAFAVSSQVDSRTILDTAGAEKLVGKGDMLFNPQGSGKPLRVQGSFISDREVHNVIEFVKSQVDEAEYADNVMESIEKANVPDAEKGSRDVEDELLPEAIDMVVQAQQASVSMLQRRFRIGYNRAARIIDMMEDRQIVGPADGSRPRQVLISEEDLKNMQDGTEDIED